MHEACVSVTIHIDLKKGQSLVEVLVALGIGVLFIVAAVSIIAPALKPSVPSHQILERSPTYLLNRVADASSTEYVSPYSYKFWYPSNYRIASNFAKVVARSESKDDVVLLTTGSQLEEDSLAAAIAELLKEGGGLDLTHDTKFATFAHESILITPGQPGDIEFVREWSAPASKTSQLRRLGYVAIDYSDVRGLATKSGTAGIEFTVVDRRSAADTQTTPVTEAIFPLTRSGVFPAWEVTGSDESSTIQIKIPSDASESLKAAFQEIVETMVVY
jgi:hypothetical protein